MGPSNSSYLSNIAIFIHFPLPLLWEKEYSSSQVVSRILSILVSAPVLFSKFGLHKNNMDDQNLAVHGFRQTFGRDKLKQTSKFFANSVCSGFCLTNPWGAVRRVAEGHETAQRPRRWQVSSRRLRYCPGGWWVKALSGQAPGYICVSVMDSIVKSRVRKKQPARQKQGQEGAVCPSGLNAGLSKSYSLPSVFELYRVPFMIGLWRGRAMRYVPPSPSLPIKLAATGLECKAVSIAAVEFGGGWKQRMWKFPCYMGPIPVFYLSQDRYVSPDRWAELEHFFVIWNTCVSKLRAPETTSLVFIVLPSRVFLITSIFHGPL